MNILRRWRHSWFGPKNIRTERSLQEILRIELIVNNRYLFHGGGFLLQRLEFGEWIIDIDKETTRKYYESIIVSAECQCLYCKNYREACNIFTSKVKTFFDNLGIIPHREGEFAEVTIDDKNHMYIGFYHLVVNGNIKVSQKAG